MVYLKQRPHLENQLEERIEWLNDNDIVVSILIWNELTFEVEDHN